MNLSVISFTENGRRLSVSLSKKLEADVRGKELAFRLYCKSGKYEQPEDGVEPCREPLSEWSARQFEEKNGILFIGACGIAVRAIAPCLKDKLHDVPVVVMDEAGRFVIPVLSGHYGGANELAALVADVCGAAAVITTATDVNKRFAVDVFARKNGMAIREKDGIRKVSSAVLRGEKVSLAIERTNPSTDVTGIAACEESFGSSLYAASDGSNGNKADAAYEGCLPEELTLVSSSDEAVSVLISPWEQENKTAKADLQLYPKAFVIGIGCRRGRSEEAIASAVKKHLERMHIPMEAVYEIASIDLKKDEAGIVSLAERYHLPFQTFSAEELKKVEGNFTASSFVSEKVGVDNVCERAALAACGEGGRLLLKKQAEDGVTVAVAEKKWRVCFDEK